MTLALANRPVHIVPPRFHRPDLPAGLVFRTAAVHGPLGRDEIASITGLSIATVNRQATALLAAGLLRERADLTVAGAVGRPRIPLEANQEGFAVAGIHIGAVTTTLVVSDLRGQILEGARIQTPQSEQGQALRGIANSAADFLRRSGAARHRRLLWAGVALGGRVDATTGSADHARLSWVGAPVANAIAQGIGVPVSVSPHVEAMAAAELLAAPGARAASGSSLFLYARETVGVALTIDGRVHTPRSGPGSVAHLPSGSDIVCECGRRGCLEATVSDRATLEAAIARGVFAGTVRPTLGGLFAEANKGNVLAVDVLGDRATALGRAAALLNDLINPDQIIVAGQAFTGYPPAMREFAGTFSKESSLPANDVITSRFGGLVQEHAATASALSVLYADPFGALRRTA